MLCWRAGNSACCGTVTACYRQYKVDGVEMCRIADALRTVELPCVPTETAITGKDTQPPVSRREAVLVAASRLFASQGFVSLADVGTAAGIAAPRVYNHFASKHDLLVTALTRGTESMWLSLYHVLRTADGPADALDRAIDGYFSFATANPDLVRLQITEVLSVPPEQQEAVIRTWCEYSAELVALVQRARPGLSADRAWVLVLGAIGVINALIQLPDCVAGPRSARSPTPCCGADQDVTYSSRPQSPSSPGLGSLPVTSNAPG